jgi:hypothetical protein
MLKSVARAVAISFGSAGALLAVLKFSGQLDAYEPDKDRRRARLQLIQEQYKREMEALEQQQSKDRIDATEFMRQRLPEEQPEDSWAVTIKRDVIKNKSGVMFVSDASLDFWRFFFLFMQRILTNAFYANTHVELITMLSLRVIKGPRLHRKHPNNPNPNFNLRSRGRAIWQAGYPSAPPLPLRNNAIVWVRANSDGHLSVALGKEPHFEFLTHFFNFQNPTHCRSTLGADPCSH